MRTRSFWRSRSPNGQRVPEIADTAIFVLDLASGDELQVTPWADASILDWSPDGAWIVYVRGWWRDQTDEGDLWRIHPDGSGLEQLTTIDTNGSSLHRPRYTPDGAWVLFSVETEATDRLWAVPAAGGAAIEVLPGTTVVDFDVRPGPGAP